MDRADRTIKPTMEKVMSQLIARVVSSSSRPRAGARLTVSLRNSRAAVFSLLADRALAA